MTTTDDKKPDEDTPTASQVLAAALPAVRARQGLSAEDLAARVKLRGGKLDRAAISKIENGTRGVSLDDAILLAVALGVSPLHLFTPREDNAFVRVTPTEYVTAGTVRRWIRGTTPLKGQDDRVYRTEVPESEWKAVDVRINAAREAVDKARRRLRIARATADEMLSELANLEAHGFTSAFGAGFASAGLARMAGNSGVIGQLADRLMVAYDRIAEAKIDLEDAEDALARLEREAPGVGD
jgi:transcriptional regulator with XRE-family HTH domain